MPKTLEVDEAEWLGSQRLRDTLVKVANHPKAKLLLQEAHKLVDPAAITPDLDRKTEEDGRVNAVQKKLDDFLEAQAKEKAGMSNVNIFKNSASSIPTSDGQIIRVDMEQIDIGGRKSHLPSQNKSEQLGLSHVPNAGTNVGTK